LRLSTFQVSSVLAKSAENTIWPLTNTNRLCYGISRPLPCADESYITLYSQACWATLKLCTHYLVGKWLTH